MYSTQGDLSVQEEFVEAGYAPTQGGQFGGPVGQVQVGQFGGQFGGPIPAPAPGPSQSVAYAPMPSFPSPGQQSQSQYQPAFASAQPAFASAQPAFASAQPAFASAQPAVPQPAYPAFASSQPAFASSQPAFASSQPGKEEVSVIGNAVVRILPNGTKMTYGLIDAENSTVFLTPDKYPSINLSEYAITINENAGSSKNYYKRLDTLSVGRP